ncbi:acyltransferase [Kineosporia sp. R_H_3]|uniref:acyltransferase family protein n=1 Tax=Kineosporia sp. R_H_3 TaxID=1961848 RepID=UPI0013041C44|nr:acyltransferase [Kineosporia sp. R_H_3]
MSPATLRDAAAIATSSETVARVFDPRRNSLNAQRLVLATLVIVSHSWPISRGLGDPVVLGVSLGGWAVTGFFAISGFLIYGSAQKSRLGPYIVARVRRIYPGFLVSLVVVGFVFAPLSTLVAGGTYSPASGLAFVIRNSALYLHSTSVGDTLGGVPLPRDWNGSLWTLWYEFACYLGAAALVRVGAAGTAVRRGVVLASWAAAAAILTVCDLTGTALQPRQLQTILTLGVFFLGGAVLRAFAAKVPMSGLGAGVCAIVVVLPAFVPGAGQLRSLAVPYLCIWLATVIREPAWFTRNDYSYGMYIFAFPVQQMLATAGFKAGAPWMFAVVSVVGTVPLAALSWHLVESRFLRRESARGRRTSAGGLSTTSPSPLRGLISKRAPGRAMRQAL